MARNQLPGLKCSIFSALPMPSILASEALPVDRTGGNVKSKNKGGTDEEEGGRTAAR
jgi:hypothetical protein